jgi:hypothetical protein
MRGAHSPADQALVSAILETNTCSEEMLIVDARPLVNAKANTVLGAGYPIVIDFSQ